MRVTVLLWMYGKLCKYIAGIIFSTFACFVRCSREQGTWIVKLESKWDFRFSLLSWFSKPLKKGKSTQQSKQTICSYTECFMYPAQHHILKLRLGTNSPQVPGDSWGGSRYLCLKVIWLSWPSLPCDPPPANSHRHSGTPKLRRRRRRGGGGGTKQNQSTSIWYPLL